LQREFCGQKDLSTQLDYFVVVEDKKMIKDEIQFDLTKCSEKDLLFMNRLLFLFFNDKITLRQLKKAIINHNLPIIV